MANRISYGTQVSAAGGPVTLPGGAHIFGYSIRTNGVNDATFTIYEESVAAANARWEDGAIGADLGHPATFGDSPLKARGWNSPIVLVVTGIGAVCYVRTDV